MRRMMALITAVLVLCAGCGGQPEQSVPDTRAASAAVENWLDLGGWTGESLERQRRLVRWYNLNLQSEQPEPGFREGYDHILAGPGGIMGWVEFPHVHEGLPMLQDCCPGEGFLHQKDTPFPTGEGGTSVLRFSSEQQELWIGWLALEPGQVFRIHILDLVVTYRIHSLESGDDPSGWAPADDRCVLIFPRDGDDIIVLAIREDS